MVLQALVRADGRKRAQGRATHPGGHICPSVEAIPSRRGRGVQGQQQPGGDGRRQAQTDGDPRGNSRLPVRKLAFRLLGRLSVAALVQSGDHFVAVVLTSSS